MGDDSSRRKNEEVLLGAVSKMLMKELSNENDINMALRKALLGLILLVPKQNEVLSRFIYFLLLEFHFLGDEFENHKHPLIGNEEVIRARDAQDNVVLLLRENYLESLVG